MIIHAHILAYNEEKILPFTLDHYSKICDKIFIYDNMSTDSSDDIYKKYQNVTVIKWDNNNEINEYKYLEIKNNGYKKYSRSADWVIVCDCDEFLYYHDDLYSLLNKYQNKGITVPLISGHDMVSNSFPEYDGDLLINKIKIGSKRYEPMCKNIIFNPKLDVNYGIGGHSFNASGAKYSDEYDLKLLHYKFLGKEYVKNIYIQRAKRLSEFNKKNKLGVHYYNLPFKYMDELLSDKYNVI